MVLALGLSALQLLVFAVILCPLAVFFVFGLYISAALSLWRLIEHDFTNADGGSNLKPALEVLYGLAVAQGILYRFWTLPHPPLRDHWDRQFVLGRLLTRSAASGHMIQRLLETLALGSRHYGLKEVECAARVLAYAAVNILLLRFTEVIPFISCLLDTLELEESPKESLEVATKVARILRNLATEEDNCRIIMSAEGVLSNTVRHLVSVQDHRGYKFHDEWCDDGVFDWICLFSPRLKKRSSMRQGLAREKLKAMLLKYMLGCGSSTSEETRAAETRPNDGQLSARSSDIEKGSEEQDASSPPQRNGEQQHMGIELQEAYISLCRVVSQNLLADHGNKLNAIAANACLEQGIPMPVKDFESLVSYAQDRLEEQKKRLAQ
ncbi:hypothetical protein HU200_003255 [Digitaria exilis]|uniref:Uncharacterized protein n=1 Tax=Digitaria exilis TaxID=1010633 RepID=A0A835FWP5_9POAL|nr:hypothetical protein HU200_003255 [Digitaria exilis]